MKKQKKNGSVSACLNIVGPMSVAVVINQNLEHEGCRTGFICNFLGAYSASLSLCNFFGALSVRIFWINSVPLNSMIEREILADSGREGRGGKMLMYIYSFHDQKVEKPL